MVIRPRNLGHEAPQHLQAHVVVCNGRHAKAVPGRQAVTPDAARVDLFLEPCAGKLQPAAKGGAIDERELRFGILQVEDVQRP